MHGLLIDMVIEFVASLTFLLNKCAHQVRTLIWRQVVRAHRNILVAII